MAQGLRIALRGLNRRNIIMIRNLSTASPTADANTQSSNGGTGSGKHLQITAHSTRIPVLAKAVVTDMRYESPSVKGLTLQVNNPLFNFKAGQWVDMFIPGMETVGGFSMYSSPSQLAESGTIELGVKFSKWPPAFWIHKLCKIGSTVALRVGGDFYYAPEMGDSSYNVLLVGGGVGVNPLASMFLHANSLHKIYQENNEEYRPGKMTLLYSAKIYEELLYKSLLDTTSAITPETQVRYFTTRKPPPEASDASHGQITREVLQCAVESLDASSLVTFVCGPPPMIESINEHLLACGLSQNQILYEKWW